MTEHLNSKPVLMDFWAPWCKPCDKIKPALARLEKEYAGKLEIKQVNVDEHPELALKYQVMAIPTLLLVRDEKEIARIVGVRGYKEIKEKIEKSIG